MASYRSAIREAEKLLAPQDRSQLSKLFMLELTRNANIDLYMEYESDISTQLLTTFHEGIARMQADEPMQYVLGYEWFYGRKITVNPGVLIPRPETEELVANVLMKIDDRLEARNQNQDNEAFTVIDVGCGSGAIGITLALEEPSLMVFASDISEEAIGVAKKNAADLKASITFMVGSMLEPLIEAKRKVDVIVCNPPYIPAEENLERTVKDFEPNVALFGGNDGLYFYRLVFDHCLEVLKPNGFMAFEIGYDQKEALISEVTKRFPQAKADVLVDMYGKDRMLFVDFPTNIEAN